MDSDSVVASVTVRPAALSGSCCGASQAQREALGVWAGAELALGAGLGFALVCLGFLGSPPPKEARPLAERQSSKIAVAMKWHIFGG